MATRSNGNTSATSDDDEQPSEDATAAEDTTSGADGESPDEDVPVEPKPTKVKPTLSAEEQSEAIKKIDQLETKIGYIGAALLVALALLQTIPGIRSPHQRLAVTEKPVKNTCIAPYSLVKSTNLCTAYITHSRSYYELILVVLLFLAALVFVAVRLRRRSFLAFASLLSGIGIGGLTGSLLAGLPFIAFGGWVVMRAWRVQKYGTTNSKEVYALQAERRAQSKAAQGKPAQGKPVKGASGKAQVAPTGRPKPSANKRYTPKQAPRKKVPPPE